MTAHTQDRIAFSSAGAVPPQFRRPRPLFETRICQMSADEIARKIDQLRPMAESGEDWAYICALEAEAVKRNRKEPSIREAFAQLGVALADNHPVNIIGEADACDMEERAEHVQGLLTAVETYLTAILADAKHRTSGLAFDVNVLGILSDTRGDLVGTFRIAAEQMREFEQEHE